MADEFRPKILAFLCHWCAYAGADLAGISRAQYPPTIRVIRTMCSGRVDPLYIVYALEEGFDGVLVSGWHLGECHYQDGNVHASKKTEVVRYLLELAGIGADRMRLYWVSAAEGQLFARYVMEYTEAVLAQGPFFSEDFREPLAAVEATLNSPRVRWLTGMDVQVTDRGNVYGERLDQARYHELIRDAVAEEYEKALISETLKSGPHSVRNIALETGLPIYTVSCRLNELERGRRVQLEGYRGTTPLFSRSAE